MKNRAIIFSKTVVVADNQRELYAAIAETVDRIEEIGQMYGWSKAIVGSRESSLPQELKGRLDDERD